MSLSNLVGETDDMVMSSLPDTGDYNPLRWQNPTFSGRKISKGVFTRMG